MVTSKRPLHKGATHQTVLGAALARRHVRTKLADIALAVLVQLRIHPEVLCSLQGRVQPWHRVAGVQRKGRCRTTHQLKYDSDAVALYLV